MRLHLDGETYCDLDIRKAGGGRYLRDPSFEVLMLGWAINDGPVQLWEPRLGPIPPELDMALRDPVFTIHAFNAPFERGLLKRLGYDLPPERFRCTMVEAYALSFTGMLDQVLQQVGFPPEQQKLKDGRKLIQRFCKPAPRNHKARRYDWTTHPEEWDRFRAYCVQDVEVERQLWHWLQRNPNMSQEEWELWCLDQRINEKGLPVDLDLAHSAMLLHQKNVEQLQTALDQRIGGHTRGFVLEWFQQHGVHIPDMQAATLDRLIAGEYLRATDPELVLWAATRYRAASQTASSKWGAFIDKACGDGTLKGMFQFAGGSRTRRWASRGINLQNLRRPGKIDQDTAVALIDLGDLETLGVLGDPTEVLASTVRAGIYAPKGFLEVCDLGSIESRVLGWISGCTRINEIFASGKDTYKDFATELYQVPYDAVTKEQRTFCKPPVLGAGYQLGGPGLREYAASMGVDMDKRDAYHAVRVWRDTYPEVPAMWYWLTDACMAAIRTPGLVMEGYTVAIWAEGDFLWIRLPSGRRLAYFKPEIQWKTITWEDEEGETHTKDVQNITYMGVNRYTDQWERIGTHGGGLTENIDQAISRDILAHGMRLADEAGLDVRGHVHDEIITLDGSGIGWLQELRRCMTQTPEWAPGLLLDADGYTAKRYRKD